MSNPYATHRRPNVDWSAADADLAVPSWERVNTTVLMDIRAELQKLNAVFACQNFLDVPSLLRAIDKNTRKPRKKKAVKR